MIHCISTKTETTAGHNPNLSPDQSVVTTVASQLEPVGNSCTIQTPNVTPGTHQCTIDFSFVREQVNFDQVLNHLGIRDQFKGRTQLRGPCPLCQKNSSRTLSVNLQKNAYKCFNPNCSQGNVLDFWRALQDLSLVDAAQHLVQTFHLRTRRES